MRGQGDGSTLRALGFALVVLAAVVAVPAFSVAQEAAPPEPSQPAPAPPATPAPVPSPEAPAGEEKPDDRQDPEAAPAPDPTPVQAAAPAAAGSRAGVQARAAAASVSVGDNFYSPTTVSVSTGETVSWTNNGQAPHSATANDGSFDTGVFNAGATRSETFRTAGTFAYYCIVHGLSQSGTVRVASASGGGGGGNSGGGGGAGTSASTGPSEAAAVASPDAAGTSTTLPATGLAVIGLGGTGLLLLLAGIAAERRQRPRASDAPPGVNSLG